MSDQAPAPLEDEFVTGGELARRLGVSRERVRQLAARPGFPAPRGRLGQAKIWAWAEVDEWRRADGRVPPVEIFSATDPPYIQNRQVWYWMKFGENEYERSTDYAVVLRQAEQFRAEQSTVVIDRSDKGSGFLRATLGR